MPSKLRLNCYFGCTNVGPLHHFPNPKSQKVEDVEKFSLWKAVLDLATQQKGNFYIYNHILLCNNHFLDSYQLPSRRLTKNAIPTLNLVHQTSAVPTVLSPTGLQILMQPANQDEQPPTTAMVIPVYEVHQTSAVPTVLSPTGLQLLMQPANEEEQPSTSATAIQVHEVKPQLSTVASVALQPSSSTVHKSTGNRKNYQDIKLIKKLKTKLEKITLKYKKQKKQIQAAKKISMNAALSSLMEKLPESMRTFTKLQLKCSLKPRGRRFTNEEKVMALSILKESPKAYEILQKMFVLPSKRSMQALLHSSQTI